MAIHYNDTIQNLKNIMQGIQGQWSEPQKGQFTFKTYDGGVLNWWPSTGTIQIQGKPSGRILLENILSIHLDSPPSPIKDKNKLDDLKIVIQYDISAADTARQFELRLQSLGVENISLMQIVSNFR